MLFRSLAWAASEGHKSLVEQLLGQKDVNPDQPDNEGRAPLSWAMIGGHELVVKQLWTVKMYNYCERSGYLTTGLSEDL